jgi:hypothetical protein
MVLVSQAWGFIVVYEKCQESKFVEVYTVNGDFVKRKEVKAAVKVWTTWRSTAGFDYIIMALKSGSIFAAETFILKFEKLGEGIRDVEGIFYSEKLGIIFANLEDGRTWMIPYRPK